MKTVTNVVGITFRQDDFDYVLDNIPVKDYKVELVLEPDNQYDSNAVKVVVCGKHIGYLSKDINKTVNLDSEVTIKELDYSDNNFPYCILEINDTSDLSDLDKALL